MKKNNETVTKLRTGDEVVVISGKDIGKKGTVEKICQINKQEGQLKKELTKQILSKAAVYQKQSKDKKFKPYRNSSSDNTRE